ncbi:MAG: flavodoxin family protein [Intestinibacter sp.]|uniref:flavodoxin family protein n=1 Tax=Intestinibacter sp. TaxID=1965304 RepID=UPI0025BF89B5|nr:flavodoxin family protein [Intestinibacter sp.]MCI6736763.1 flavodoxin family protein [Intestinibacter sp.]
MKITVIHGQSHKGVTYKMTHTVLEFLMSSEDELKEFFLPKNGPGFCVGCNNCFLKGEEHCPGADKVQPIIKSMEESDVIILDSPNYVMEMSGGMKNLMDHFAYRWITHRPHGKMFTKVGITISSSAGALANHTVRSMAKQLKWMGVPKVYTFPLISNAMGINDLNEKKEQEIKSKAQKVATKVKKRVQNPHASLRSKIMFSIFRKMQSSPDAGWNPTDREWWINNGWTKDVRPWRQ